MSLFRNLERKMRSVKKYDEDYNMKRYAKLKSAGLSLNDIKECIDFNEDQLKDLQDKERKEVKLSAEINEALADIIIDEVESEEKPVETTEETIIDAEIVEETKEEKPVETTEEAIKKMTDEQIKERAINELVSDLKDKEKEDMVKILKDSFDNNESLVKLYRDKYIALAKTEDLANNALNNIDQVKNTKKASKEMKKVIDIDDKIKEILKDEDDNFVYLNIAPEDLDILIDDLKDTYDELFGVNTNRDQLRSVVLDILDKNKSILEENQYIVVFDKTKAILDNMIDSNTIELGNDNNDDELLQNLNAIFDIK